MAHYELGSYTESLRFFQDARDIQEKLLEMAKAGGATMKEQRKTIEFGLCHTLSNIAFVYCKQFKYEESVQLLREVKKLQRNLGGLGAPKIRSLHANLQYVGGLAEDFRRKKRCDTLQGQSPMDRVIETVMDKMRCF